MLADAPGAETAPDEQAADEPPASQPLAADEQTGDEPPAREEWVSDVTFEPPTVGPDLLGDHLVARENLLEVAFRPTDGRPFVVDRFGQVLMLEDAGDVVTVLDVTEEVTADVEWGLLGMAFSPDGAHAYLNETDGFETRIHEFPVTEDGSFDLDGRRIVYRFDQPADGHNGGDLLFGPDGYLYVFNGDGGGDRDDEENGGATNSDIYRQALATDSPLGKILRIDPAPSGGATFTIPEGNPFVDEEGALAEIWAIGVRNPWRNGFDPDTGDLWVADVGNIFFEEISRAPAAGDGTGAGRAVSFGWSAYEGFTRNNEDQPASGHLSPLYVYEHQQQRCSVVGGPVYRGTSLPELDGHYLFGDFCSGEVWAMELTDRGPTGSVVQVATWPFLVDITVGPDGVVYLTSIVEGVRRLESAAG